MAKKKNKFDIDDEHNYRWCVIVERMDENTFARTRSIKEFENLQRALDYYDEPDLVTKQLVLRYEDGEEVGWCHQIDGVLHPFFRDIDSGERTGHHVPKLFQNRLSAEFLLRYDEITHAPIIYALASRLEDGSFFKKKNGSVVHLKISDSAVRAMGLPQDKVYGVALTGHVSRLEPNTKVVLATREEYAEQVRNHD